MSILSRLGWMVLFALGITICAIAFLVSGSANVMLHAAAWPLAKIQSAALKTMRDFNRAAQ
jgi:hypothetical protein